MRQNRNVLASALVCAVAATGMATLTATADSGGQPSPRTAEPEPIEVGVNVLFPCRSNPFGIFPVVIFGRPDFAAADILPDSIEVENRPVLEVFGFPVAFGSDVNTDGFEDLVALIGGLRGFTPAGPTTVTVTGVTDDGTLIVGTDDVCRRLPPPDTTLPDTTLPPETTVPPETTDPETTVPETTVPPPTTVPPETTVPPTTEPTGECDPTQDTRGSIAGRVVDVQGRPHVGHVILRDRGVLVGSILAETSALPNGFFELNPPDNIIVSPGCDTSYVIEVDSVSDDGVTELFGEFDVTALLAGALPGVDFAVDIRLTPIVLNVAS